MTRLDPLLFAKLVDSYCQEFGELFEVAEEQQDVFERNREILVAVVEADKTMCDKNVYSLDNYTLGVVSSDHPIATMGINVVQWIFEKTKNCLKTFQQSYQLLLSLIESLTGIVKVVFIIVGSFRSVLDEGLFIPNNKTSQSIWEDVKISLEKMNSLISEAYGLLLMNFSLKHKYEVPNKLQSIADFISLRLPCDTPTISKRYVDCMSETAETMLANFSELTFVAILSYRESLADDAGLLFCDVVEEITDEAKDAMKKLENKWADIIKYSDAEISDEQNSKKIREDYIKRVKHSKEYFMLKETSKLRLCLKELDDDLAEIEQLGLDIVNKQFPPEHVTQIVNSYSGVYHVKFEALKSALERHEFLFNMMHKASNSQVAKKEDNNVEQISAQECTALDEARDAELQTAKLEYENEANDVDDDFVERDNIGDEFFQTKGGLGLDSAEICIESEDAREQEMLFKFVVKELKGKLSDVSVVMKEREKQAKRKIYGEESSSDEEEVISPPPIELISASDRNTHRNRTVIEGVSNPDELTNEPNSLASEGFPVFFNSELEKALKLRLKDCVTEEFEYSEDSDD